MIDICILIMDDDIDNIIRIKHNFLKTLDKISDDIKLSWVMYFESFNVRFDIFDAIIISGSKYSVLKKNSPKIPKKLLKLDIPILAICYGFQAIAKMTCNKKTCINSFYTKELNIYSKFIEILHPFKVPRMRYYFAHHDFVKELSNKWMTVIEHDDRKIMSIKDNIIGVQFHPERYKTAGLVFFKAWLKYNKLI